MTAEHPDIDIRIDVDGADATLAFGPDLAQDDVPIDGEVVRADDRLWMVGIMDSADPPLLHLVDEVPNAGLWWNADDDCAG